MIKLIFLFITAFTLVACDKGNNNLPDATLTVNPAELSFTAQATESHDVTVTTNQSSWDVVSSQSWCTVTKVNGKFTVTAVVNTSTSSPVPAVITVTAGSAKPVNINVTQAGIGAELSITPDTPVSFTSTGNESETKTITVTTNQSSWNVASNQTWCTVNKSGNTFTITASTNMGAESRNAAITVSAGNAANVTIDVTQARVVTVVNAEYITPDISGYFNPLRANYTINWSVITGSAEYNVYKSNASSGEGTLVATTSDMTITSTEILTTEGTHIRYYWVTAKTNAGETPRPDHGGIKVTYTVTLATRVWMTNNTPPLYGYWTTIGVDRIERAIAQNPIK